RHARRWIRHHPDHQPSRLDVDPLVLRHLAVLDRGVLRHTTHRRAHPDVEPGPSTTTSVHIDVCHLRHAGGGAARDRSARGTSHRRMDPAPHGAPDVLFIAFGWLFVYPTGRFLDQDWISLSFVDERFATALDRWYGGSRVAAGDGARSQRDGSSRGDVVKGIIVVVAVVAVLYLLSLA